MKKFKIVVTIFGLKSLTFSQFIYLRQGLHDLNFEISTFEVSVQTWYQSVQKNVWLFHIHKQGKLNVTNTIMYLPQVHWGVNQIVIWSQLTVCWV